MKRIPALVVSGFLGSGKTTLCETACLWAILIGARPFVCLIGSDEGHAMDMLESIKTELDANELLLADYPEIHGAIRQRSFTYKNLSEEVPNLNDHIDKVIHIRKERVNSRAK